MKPDWADKIIANIIRREGTCFLTAETLRNQVKNQCDHNIHSWGQSWTPEKREKERKKETKRLIKLEQDNDSSNEFVYQYDKQGIKVHVSYNSLKIKEVQLPLTPEEWVDLLNYDGEYLATCPTNPDRIRGILAQAVHNNCYCETRDLWELVLLAKDYKNPHPLSKLISLWNKIKKDSLLEVRNTTSDLNNPQDALKTLANCSETIDYIRLVSNDKDVSEQRFNDKALNEYSLATVLVCVRTLFLKLTDLAGPPIEGFGVFEGDRIGETVAGIAVYPTKEFADEVCKQWNKQKKTYHVCHCRISMANGLEKLL